MVRKLDLCTNAMHHLSMQFNEVITWSVVLIQKQIAYYTVLIVKLCHDSETWLGSTNRVKA